MTGVALVALYLVALSAFLGLDLLKKVPPSLYGLVLAALGGIAAVSVVGALCLVAPDAAPAAGVLGRLGLGAGITAGVAGTVAIGRLLGAFAPGKREPAPTSGGNGQELPS